MKPQDFKDFEDLDTIAKFSNLDLQLINEFEVPFNEVSENFNLLAGHIYSDDDLLKLGIEKRPAFKTNLFMPIVMRIVGDFAGNIPGLDFFGRTPDDQKKAEPFKQLNDFIFYQANDINVELAKAFLYMLVARYTWIRQDFTYNNDDEGMIEIEHYHPFLKFDTSTRKTNLRDCQFIFDDVWLTPDEIIARYAKKNPELKALLKSRIDELLGGKQETTKQRIYNYLSKLTGAILDYGGENSGFDNKRIWTKNGLVYDSKGTWLNNGRLRVTDAYVRQDFPKLVIVDKVMQQKYDFTDEVKRDDLDENFADTSDWIDQEKLNVVKSLLPDKDPYIKEETESKIVQTSFCGGLQVKLYDGLQQIQNGNFKFTKIDCYNFHPDILETRSMIDNIKDTIKSYNLRDNTELTYLLRSTHLEYLVDERLKGKVKDLQSNKIGGVRHVPEGAIERKMIERIDPPAPNLALERYKQQKWEEVKILTGVNENSLARQESQGESGKLFENRIVQTEIMQEWISKNAHNALPILAKNNIYLIQHFFTEKRTFRILAEDGTNNFSWLTINDKDEFGRIMNDMSVGEFDIEISTVPYGRIAREEDKARNLEILNITAKMEGFETINKLLVKEIIKTTNMQVKGTVLPIIDALIKKELQLISGADPNSQQAQMQNMIAQMMAQLEIESKKISNQQESVQTEGMALDNQKKKLELENQQNGIQQIMDSLRGIMSTGSKNGNRKTKNATDNWSYQ